MPASFADLRRWRVSPRLFAGLATGAAWAVALAIASGASVRLTGSGLGCSDWPACTAHHVVAPLGFHPWMEFGNRLLNVAVTVVAGAALVGAALRAPRRRDLTVLAGGLVLGVLAEAVVGGVVVLSHLAPQWVTIHFLVSILLVVEAVILRHRSRIPDQVDSSGRVRAAGPAQAVVSPACQLLARLTGAATAVVVALGTVVTSTGPHGGDPSAPRFHFSLHRVAQVHGAAVEVLLALTLLTLWSLHRSGAPGSVMRRGEVMLVVMAAQAGVGYTQYLTGDPALVVGVHVAGALCVVVAVVWFNLGLRRRPVPAPTVAELTVPVLAPT